MGSFTRDSHDSGNFTGRHTRSADPETQQPIRRLIYSQTNSRQPSRPIRILSRTSRLSGFRG